MAQLSWLSVFLSLIGFLGRCIRFAATRLVWILKIITHCMQPFSTGFANRNLFSCSFVNVLWKNWLNEIISNKYTFVLYPTHSIIFLCLSSTHFIPTLRKQFYYDVACLQPHWLSVSNRCRQPVWLQKWNAAELAWLPLFIIWTPVMVGGNH